MFFLDNWKLLLVSALSLGLGLSVVYEQHQVIKLQEKLTTVQGQLTKEQAYSTELTAALEAQNDAVTQLQDASDARLKAAQVMIDQAAKTAHGYQAQAKVIMETKPVGADCSAALTLGNAQ